MQVTELITEGWYTSGIVSRQFETVSDAETTDGLKLLNKIMNRSAIDPQLQSYQSYTEVSCVPGQETYDVPGLIDLREMTFNDGDVRFSMIEDTAHEYFGLGRVDNIQSLPFHYYAERTLGGTLIYLYFIPDKAYTLKILGKYALTPFVISDNLDDYDAWFIDYLTYLLAREICLWRKVTPPPAVISQISRYKKLIKDVSPADLTIRKSWLFRNNDINWAQYNLGRGWYPS